jgi:hypothetical protein
MDERIEKMEQMAQIEERYAMNYDKNVMGLGNIALSELMRTIALDSIKHAGLYRAIKAIISGPIAVTDMEYDTLEEKLRKHIRIEQDMMEEAMVLLEKEEDDRVKTLLNQIYLDEVRHHRFLSNLLETVVKKDEIFEEEIWKQIWLDVPTHGAPRDPYA